MAEPAKHKGSVRIIAGEWRGRRIPVADVPGLRPSGDRVRETLFNWLQAYIPGSHCLDLFAGTGALGLEAASRGATSAMLFECDPVVCAALLKFLSDIGTEKVELCQVDTLAQLAGEPGQIYDIVFVDPPFDLDVQERVVNLLSKQGWLSPNALVYVESPVEKLATLPPSGWQEVRNKTIGEVRLHLFRAPSR